MDVCVNFHEHSQICPWHIQFSSVQSLSHVQLVVNPRIAARQASLSIINKRSSLRITSIESVMPSRHLILCRPLLLLPPIPPSIMSKKYENPKQVNTKRLIPKHIIIKKTNVNGRIFKMTRETKSHIKGTPILYQLLFHSNFAGHGSVVWCI